MIFFLWIVFALLVVSTVASFIVCGTGGPVNSDRNFNCFVWLACITILWGVGSALASILI